MEKCSRCNIKCCFVFLFLIFFCMKGFCQDNGEPLDIEDEITSEEQKNSQIDKSLQGNFVIIEPVHPHELNPQVTTYASDSQFLSGLYEGLFSYNPKTLEPEFAIASNYKISRDKKRWTFTIRQNARFSNGELITAENVRDSWLQLLATPEAPYASLLDVILNADEYRHGECNIEDVGIYALSDYVLTVYLEKPANYLPRVLCHTAFSVIHRNPTVYSGAYYLYDHYDNSYILKKNPYYWDVNNTNLEQISFIQSDDADETAFCFNTGIADWVTSNINTDKIIDKKTLNLNAEFATSFFFFKHSSLRPSYAAEGYASVWDFVEFRNALFEAIPWDALRANTYVPAETLVYPLGGYPTVEGYSYTDSAEAYNLMKQAREKYDVDADEKLELVLDVSENSFPDEKLEALKNAFEPLGVELKVRTYPSQYYLSVVKQSDADLFCYVWIGDFADPLAFLELFRSDSSLNDSGWSNLEFDNLLDEAAICPEEERIKLLAQAENLLLDNYVVIPIQHPVSFNVIDLTEVIGWYANAFDIHPMKYLYKRSAGSKLPNIVLQDSALDRAFNSLLN